MFDDCEFDSAAHIEGSQLFDIGVIGCSRLSGLLANGVRIRRDLDLSRTVIAGALGLMPVRQSGQRSGFASRKSVAGCCV